MKTLLLILFLSTSLLAAKSHPLYLFTVEPKKYEEVKNERLLKARVYVKFLPEFNQMGFMLSSIEGDFSSPVEILGEGSVLSGQMLGAKNLMQNYELDSTGNWAPTKKAEQWVIWTASNPIQHRIETLIPAERALKNVKK